MTMKGRHWAGLSAAATVAALLLPGFDATAQDAKKNAKALETKGRPPARAASPCKGLDASACKGKIGECLWIVPRKGKQRPYCRLRTARRKK